MTTNVIHNFDDFNGPNDFAFLSNFYVGQPLKVFKHEWQTGEHAFQAMKSTTATDLKRVKRAKGPGMAKRIGRRMDLRDDWEVIKYDVMMAIVRAKFQQPREEATRLLLTGHALLVEGTTWNDRVWGVDKGGKFPDAKGRNWLGTMLMARRSELHAMALGAPDFRTGLFNAAAIS